MLAVALSVAEADFTLFAFFVLLDIAASVAAYVLSKLFESDDIEEDPEVLLALCISAALFDALSLLEELLVSVLLAVTASMALFVSLAAALRLEELLLLFVTSDDFVTSNSEFAPRV